MAAGDRKIKVRSVAIARGNPVTYIAHWHYVVEDKLGDDALVRAGSTAGSFGTPAAWRAMTGLQMETQVNADCTADANVPPRDSLA